jgi:hypothetical protein
MRSSNEEYVTRQLCFEDEDEDDLVQVFEPDLTAQPDYGWVALARPVVRHEMRGMLRFKDLPNDTCEVTAYVRRATRS